MYGGTLNNCTLAGNSASGDGGAARSSSLNNCKVIGNSAWNGGGVNGGALKNCTLTGNSALDKGGGAYSSDLKNCLVYFNTARTDGINYYEAALNYCCTTPLPSSGRGNITADPQFVDTNLWVNLRLQADSPCINAGDNASVPSLTDLDGNRRISGGVVDIGAYEFQLSGLQAGLGRVVAQPGRGACMPVHFESNDPLTNLTVTFQVPSGRFISFSAVAAAPEVESAVITSVAEDQVVLTVTARTGQMLRGPARHAANLCFTLATPQPSAFLPLQIVDIGGFGPDGIPLGGSEGGDGQVVVIGDEPMLELVPGTNGAMLTVYGQPESRYQVEAAGILDGDPHAWEPVFMVAIPSTNLWQAITVTPTDRATFYRARRQ